MRVTQNQIVGPYLSNLEGIQNRRLNEQLRINTGKDIVRISDNPKGLASIKELSATIDQNENYLGIIESSLSEMYAVDETLSQMQDKLTRIRDISIEAASTGNNSNLYTMGVYIKGMMNDLIKDANADFNGKFLFSGTKSDPESIDRTAQATNDMPFELITEASTPENRSGFKMVFKGNFKDRIVNKDAQTTEVINVKPDQFFGENGTEIFDTIVDIYNLLTYNTDGTKRKELNIFTDDDVGLLDSLQKNIADIQYDMSNAAAQNGTKIDRLEALRSQMEQDVIRLKDFRSLEQDADIAESALKLNREEVAMQYSLQVGSRLLRQSLFDFLA